jgi:hypothetical protein
LWFDRICLQQLLAWTGDNASALRILAGTLSCATNRLVFKQAAGRAALTL